MTPLILTRLTIPLTHSLPTIYSTALLFLSAAHIGPISIDTHSLTIYKVLDPQTLTPLPFTLSPPDRIKGSLLSVSLHNHASVLIFFSTSSDSSALRLLSPRPKLLEKTILCFCSTSGHSLPFCFPFQDTLTARICYSARLNIPRQLYAVMSARHSDRRQPIPADLNEKVIADVGFDLMSLWCAEGRIVEEFVMEQPIPSYLFAFEIGELGFREVGRRIKVYSEAVAKVLDTAAREFAGTEEMTRQGETFRLIWHPNQHNF